MLAFDLKDEKKRGLSLYSKPLTALVPAPLGLILGRLPTSHIPTWLPICWTLTQHTPAPFSFAAKKPDVPPELREVFQKAVKHVGMDESEIIFVDLKKVSGEAV